MCRLTCSLASALTTAMLCFVGGCHHEPTAPSNVGPNTPLYDFSTQSANRDCGNPSLGKAGDADEESSRDAFEQGDDHHKRHHHHSRCGAPAITTQPADVTIPTNNAATFSVIAAGTTPITYQWLMNGSPIPDATSSTYVTPVVMSDSGSTFAVVVSNSAGSTPSRAAHLTVTGTRFGLGGVQAVFPPSVTDLIGVQYHFIITVNQSPTLKIIFGINRLVGPGSSIVYPFEVNVYSNRLTYADGACGTFPPPGTDIEGQGSVRQAIADYPLTWGLQPGITTGLRTADPIAYPVTSYFVDNIATLPKSDAISQFDIDNLETVVTIQRGDTTSNVSSYAHCGRALLPGLYRRWSVQLEVTGHPSVTNEVVVPETSGRFLSPGVSTGATGFNALEFASEFLNTSGTLTVQYWGFAALRESAPIWTPVTAFTTTYQYDGNGTAYGIRVVNVQGTRRIEFSNVPSQYLPKNTSIVF